MSSLDLPPDTDFNPTFPLPYRLLALVGVGILAWATNLHVLHLSGIDPVGALELRTDSHLPRTPMSSQRANGFLNSSHGLYASPSFYLATYKTFFAYSAFGFASWILFRLCTKSDRGLVDAFAYIPLITGLLILVILICPMNILFRQERDKFLHALHRCCFSSFDAPIYFSDVIFADIATSFAKVLGDVWLSLEMLLPGSTMFQAPSEQGLYAWIAPLIMSLPYFIRFRQCVIEYRLPSNNSRRPLYNAVKYATAFPVIFLSAAQKGFPTSDSTGEADSFSIIFQLWMLAAVCNSVYSFWWDITNDWGFSLLKIESGTNIRTPPRRLLLPRLHANASPLLGRTSLESGISEDIYSPAANRAPSPLPLLRQSYPGLRAVLLYPLAVYPLLIFLNLILRMTWSIKLSSHLYSIADGSVGIFWLELAEILRRWLWVFLRVEWEVVRKMQDGNFKTRTEEVDSESDYEMLSPQPNDHDLIHLHPSA